MLRRNTIKLISLLVALCVFCSIFALSVFAEETTTVSEETETTADATETTVGQETTPTDPYKTDDDTNPTDTKDTETKKTWIEQHINLVIAAGVVVVLVIAYFVARLVSKKFKEKTTKFWKDYRAEFKKLVWPSKEQFWKNSAVVLVAVVVGAVVLALLDYGITQGFYGLKELIDTIRPAG